MEDDGWDLYDAVSYVSRVIGVCMTRFHVYPRLLELI